MPLSDRAAHNAKPLEKPYKLSDAHGLYLLVKPAGSKLWQLKYRYQGKEKKLSFGAYPLIGLAKARELREKARVLLADGLDPAEKRKEEKLANAPAHTFASVARDWHASNQRWSADHAARVMHYLEVYLFPSLGDRDITELKVRDLLEPLKAVEATGKLDVASRLQQRVTGVMRYAMQNGLIDYNPAQDLVGAIATRKANHHPALQLEQLPDFLQRLDDYGGRKLTRLAVQLALVVFIRSSELRFARWQEIDLKRAMWTLPAEREPIEGVKFSQRGSKMHTPHLVPLSRQAVVLLKRIRALCGDNQTLVFPGDHDPKKPMSENTVNKALRAMGYDTKTEVCGHGFRTMACSALVESGLWSRDAVERQMSHQERSGVRAAYIHRAEHIEERKLMVQWWADYLDANREGYVVPYEFK